jgi:dTDP-4-amino-4,6-dideoxygalactose transaminase
MTRVARSADIRAGRLSPLPFALPTIGEDEIAEVVSALRSGWITTGPKTTLFEERFGAEVGADAALALSSGTAAMHLALVAMGIGPGDRVFTSPMTFCSTVHVIEHVGARPVLVDIEPSTLNIDPAGLSAAVHEAAQDRPSAVMPVHFAGHPCDMAAIADVAAESDLCIIEDAAHAFGARYQRRPVGQLIPGLAGHAVCFSLYATKNITTGEGGVLISSPEVIAAAREWSLHGMNRDAWRRYAQGGSWQYDVIHPGFKYNFTDLQAALGIAQLRRHQQLMDRRTAIAAAYTRAFSDVDELETPTEQPDVDHAWHLYPLRLDLDRLTISRAQFVTELQGRNIGTSVHFIPVHEHTYYRTKYGWRPEDFPVAHREFSRMLSLPIYPLMTDEDVEDVVTAVRAIVTRHRRRA